MGDLSQWQPGRRARIIKKWLQPQRERHEPGTGLSDPWPNQPAGFRAFAENDFARAMIATPSATGLLGQWSTAIMDADNGYINDPAAPKSPPGVFQGRFPAGMAPGLASIKWQAWDAASNADNYGTEMSQIYLSLWLKLPGADFENQTTAGTKLFYIGYGEPKTGAGNQGFAMIKWDNPQIRRDFFLRFWQRSDGSRALDQNVDTRRLMTCGVWHRFEMVLKLNDPGVANGIFRWWIDGTLITDYRDVTYIVPGGELGFYTWKFWPYWGGVGGPNKTRDDYVQVDHAYISGVRKN